MGCSEASVRATSPGKNSFRRMMVSELGYQGIKKDYPQFDHMQGTKRLRKDNPGYEPRHGGLSEVQTKRNKETAKTRILAE